MGWDQGTPFRLSLMPSEPGAAELSAFTTLGDIASWSGLIGKPDDTSEPHGSLLDLLGTTDDTPPSSAAGSLNQIPLSPFSNS